MRRGFTIHHNGPNANCLGRPHSRCEAFWASVVRYHTVDKDWSSVAYSFGVCPHGTRFVGGGWSGRQFANGADDVGPEDGGDAHWYTVLVFLGWDEDTGAEEHPTPEMVQAVADLIDEGRDRGRCGTRVTPHNFWKAKRCPGFVFTSLAKSWDNAPLTIPDRYADAPAPLPPILQEDDDMVIVITATDRPPRALVQGKLIGFKPDPKGGSQYTDFRAAVEKAKVPIVDWVCDQAQYDAVSKDFDAGTDG